MVRLEPFVVAEVMTGKFCRPLGPVSGSPTSFAVTPVGARSMPSEVFEKIEFRENGEATGVDADARLSR